MIQNQRRYSDDRQGGRPRAGPPRPQSGTSARSTGPFRGRGTFGRGKKILSAPKAQRQLRVGGGAAAASEKNLIRQKVTMPSEVRLKVRNLDEKQVTNEDLKVSTYLS